MDPERQGAALALLRRLLPIADPSVPGYVPLHFVQLADGIDLYAVLRIVAPNAFPPTTITSAMQDDGTEATVSLTLTQQQFEPDEKMRAANLTVLLRRVAAYAKDAMGPAPTAPSVTQGLDAAAIAHLAGDGAESPLSSSHTAYPQLMQLVGVAATLVVLSGVQAVLVEVKSLPRQEQVVLSNWVRELMGHFDLKPHRHVSRPVSSNSSEVATSPVTAAPGGASAAKPSVPLASTGSAAGGVSSASAPQHTSPTTAPAPAPAPPSRMAAGEAEDEGYYRNATYQLRNELTELKAELAALQDAYRISKEDKDTAESKYRLLLDEQAKVSPGLAGTTSDASNTVESMKEMLRLSQERCNKKDETIAALSSNLEQQSTQVSALKEAAAAHEMALQTLRRRLKTAEEGVMVKSEERREALQKLAVTEDKLAAQMKARVELENQVEELQSRVLVLTSEQERLRGVGYDDNAPMNSSFVSNGSVDRVMSLENELDEVRQQRDSLQRQVGILQRQVAAMPTPVADATTAKDTWRAQLRQVEREREDLRQQLTTALERVGGLQQQVAAAAAAATAGTIASLSSGSGSLGRTGPDGNTSVADGSDLEASLPNAAVVGDASRHRGSSSGGLAAGKSRDAARREQVILSSLLLQYSYRNLLLQQHETLLHKDSTEAEAAQRLQAEEHLDIARHTPSSLLTKQRRDVEQGLLESVLHGAKLRMMRVEQ